MTLAEYRKKKDFLICVDSDGCAVDTMDIKHRKCFGPCMVAEWGLEAWSEPILARWNDINLYSMTRGINRFKGLRMALEEIDARYTAIDGLDALAKWVDGAKELSNPALKQEIACGGAPILIKALSWSEAVNRAIADLPWSVKRVFPGVKEAFTAVRPFADIAAVSSANRDAVEEEWEKFGLMPLVDICLCQDAGSKAHCLKELAAKGYVPDHILMAGDAPGDQAAAEKNGVYFYPILVRREAESWAGFPGAAQKLFDGSYAEYERIMKEEFIRNLQQ